MKMNHKGFTLFEAIVVSMLMGLLLLTIAEMVSHTISFFHNTSVRQQLQSDCDTAVNTAVRALQLAQKSSITLCSCAATTCSATCNSTAPAGTPPNSRIEFKPIGSNTVTAIYQQGSTMYMQVGARSPQALTGSNVQGLMFSGDAQDLSRIYISLTLSAATASNQTETITVPNQAVRLLQ